MPDKSTTLTQKVLFSALEALEDYLSDIVIVGGWVPQIYALKENLEELPVYSFDVDAAVRGPVPSKGRKSIAELMEQAGFKKETTDSAFAMGAFGKKKKFVTHFVYKKGNLEVPVEFIAPLEGRGEDAYASIQEGLVVEALRFTEILVEHSQAISINGETAAGKRKIFSFRVPSIAAFIYAKGLTFPRRNIEEKSEKDLAYMYEVLRRDSWRKQVVQEIPGIAAKHPANWLKTFRKNLDEAFQTAGSAGPAGIARQFPNKPPQDTRRESFDLFRSFLKDIAA